MPEPALLKRLGAKLRALLHRSKSPPLATRRQLRDAIDAYRRSAILYVAAKLRLADLLAEGPRTGAQLAATLGAHPESLHRVLRALTALGVCAEEPDGRFALTDVGSFLRDAHPDSVRPMAVLGGEELAPAYGGLLRTVMTGQTAFDQVFGMGPWYHRAKFPELAECFNRSLHQGAASTARAVLGAYDFSSCRTIADVGGGHGAFLAAVLREYPAAAGMLFDDPGIVAAAAPFLQAAGVSARVKVAGGNFFDGLPPGADIHILKSVLHDWTDEQSLAILRNCHRALPDRGRILLVERLLPLRAVDDPATVLVDLHMLVTTGGRERTAAEFHGLLRTAGFQPGGIIATRSAFHIIEGVRR
jgi:hypothetical protein